MVQKYKEMLKKIDESFNVVIMSHRNIDLDGLGSSLGCFNICKNLNKKAYIVMEENILDDTIIESQEYLNNHEYFPNFVGANEIKSIITDNTLLIIVDVSNEFLFLDSSLLKIKNKIIIDHHILKEEFSNDILMIHDTKASSASEIITNICIENKIKLDAYVSTILLAGIIIDTTNFKYKVSSKTFKTAAYLSENGASMDNINYITQISLTDFLKHEEIKKNAYLVNDNYLIAFDKENVYKQSDLSVVSKELLLINDVYMSIVVGNLDNDCIGISINSINNYNSNKLASSFNGGGHNHSSAAQIKKGNLEKIINQIEQFIEKEM